MKRQSNGIINRIKSVRPGVSLIGFYMVTILAGAAILKLPISRLTPIDFVDCIFTSASALTITGLITVDTTTAWSPFGLSVILILIQLGGIGIMSVTTLAFLSAGRASLSMERLYFQELVGSSKITNALTLVKKVVFLTLALEAIGAVLIFGDLVLVMPPLDALGSAVFHSVSAFCHAGFALQPDSYMDFAHNPFFIIVNSVLIMAGGFGFLVLVELWDTFRNRGQRVRFSLHLRLVIYMSFLLVAIGTILLWLTKDFDFITAIFHSITARSAGFNTIDLSAVNLPAIGLIMILMYVGAGPGSTGGGIKVTSLAVLVALGVQRFRGKNHVTLLNRTLPTPLVIRAVAVALIGISGIALTTGLLVVFQTTDGPAAANLLRDALFEATSAVCTVGLSIGLTMELTTASKFTVILAMIVGRLGFLTIAYGLAARSGVDKIKYAEGNLMIG